MTRFTLILSTWRSRAAVATLVFVLGFAHLALAAETSQWGLVRVCSSYRDEAKPVSDPLTPFCGTGTLIEVRDFSNASRPRTFVLTAAHVSQGEELVVGDGFEVTGRLANNRRDLELLEVKNPALAPAAFWFSEQRRVVFEGAVVERWRKSHALVYQEEASLGPGRAFVLKPSWSMPGTLDAPTLDLSFLPLFAMSAEPVNRLMELPISEELLGRGEISEQMSGAPLIQGTAGPKGQLLWVLRGVATQMSRDFVGSWFVSDQVVARLLTDYLQGRKKPSDPTHWRLWSGITYRDYGGGSLEAHLLRHYVGGATRGDGGGATRGEGGREVGAEAQVNGGRPVSELFAPGLVFQGTPVMGLTVAKDRTVFADRMALDLMQALDIEAKLIEVVSEGTSLRPLLVARLENFPWFKLLARAQVKQAVRNRGAFVLESMQNPFEVQASGPARSRRHTILVAEDGAMSFELDLGDKEPDWLRFKLDFAGRALDGNGETSSKAFSAVVHVVSSQGTEYAVDLRRLFFIDLASAGIGGSIPWFHLSQIDRGQQINYAMEKAASEAPSLVIRASSSRDTSILQFTRALDASGPR